MSIGYFSTLAEANEFIESNRPIYDEYDSLPDNKKIAYLNNCYNRIFYGSGYTLPALADASTDDLFVLKLAQMEMTIYATIHLQDEDSRIGIKSQGVVEAGIVKEKYNSINEMPILPIVENLLKPWKDSDIYGGIGAFDIERDEGETVNSNPSGY